MPLRTLDRWEAVVAAAWVAMTAQAAVFVARHGHNLPKQDEWAFVGVLYGQESRVEWVFARHYEHRYPLARVLYLGLDAVSGHDFRAGMWVSVALLSAAAFVLVRTARRARGRSHPLDVLFPVLLLNAGHCENLLMGYQIAFTLTALLVAVLLWVMSAPRPSGLAAGALLLAIMLGGGVGLAFVPPVCVWVAYHASRERRWKWLVCPAVAVAYAGFAAFEAWQSPPTTARNDAVTTARLAFEFLAQGVGGAARLGWPVLGLLVALGQLDTALTLRRGLLRSSHDRAIALGWLGVLAAVWLTAVAVGHARPSATDFRYTTPSCLAACVCGLAAARFGPRRAWPGGLFVLAAAGLIAYFDWQFGQQFAAVYDHRRHALQADIRAGVPADLLAERNTFFATPEYRDDFRKLYESGHPALRGAAPPIPLTAVEVPLPTPRLVVGSPVELRLADPRRVKAVRVHFDNDVARYFEAYQLGWSGPAGDGTSNVFPWLGPRPGTTSFWIDAEVSAFTLRAVPPTKGLTLTRVELLVAGQ